MRADAAAAQADMVALSLRAPRVGYRAETPVLRDVALDLRVVQNPQAAGEIETEEPVSAARRAWR